MMAGSSGHDLRVRAVGGMIFDLVVLGAGVVGISISQYFSEKYPDWNILLVEKNSRHGLGISSRNSEVVHAGIYYPQDWLKSRLCIDGRTRLYPFLEKYCIPHKKRGKMIVAVTGRQVMALKALFLSAMEKGVEGLQWMNGKEISVMEPEITGIAGFFSRESGVLSVDRYMAVLLNLFQANGGGFLPATRFLNMQPKHGLMELCFGSETDSEEQALTKRVVNATGLSADHTAKKAHFVDIPKIHYCKGHYYQVTGARKRFEHMVYPIPDETFLGIHITPDLSGELKLGPDAVYLPENVEDYSRFLTTRKIFVNDVKRYWPGVTAYVLEPAMIGIRPKLYRQGEPARDFIIRDESIAGYPNWINLFGIESPGITTSLAIGPYIDAHIFGEIRD